MKEAENALRSFMLAVRKYLVKLRLLESRTSSGGSPRSQRKEDELVRKFYSDEIPKQENNQNGDNLENKADEDNIGTKADDDNYKN
mgnify:CR=1 FL=1